MTDTIYIAMTEDEWDSVYGDTTDPWIAEKLYPQIYDNPRSAEQVAKQWLAEHARSLVAGSIAFDFEAGTGQMWWVPDQGPAVVLDDFVTAASATTDVVTTADLAEWVPDQGGEQ